MSVRWRVSLSGPSLSTNFFTWVEFRLYWTPSGESATTLFPVFSSTRKGAGLRVGVNLLVCSCFSNILSPSFSSLSRAPRFSSAYNFPLSLASLSVSYSLVVHLKFLDSWNPGPQRPSEHEFFGAPVVLPVVLCGVVLCMTRKDSISFLQSFFSICAILILLSSDQFCLSTSPLACHWAPHAGAKASLIIKLQFNYFLTFTLSVGRFSWAGKQHLLKSIAEKSETHKGLKRVTRVQC